MENRAFPRELRSEITVGLAGVTAVTGSRACLRPMECAERRMRVVPRKTFTGLSSPNPGTKDRFFVPYALPFGEGGPKGAG